MSKVLSFQLPDVLYDAIEQIAKAKDRSKAYIVRDFLEEALYDQYAYKVAEQAAKEIEEGKARLIPWEEVRKTLYDVED